MSTGASEILSAALSLSDDERASIAYELLHSLKPSGILSEDDPNFLAELERRAEAFDRGETTAHDWEEVSRELRQMLRERRSS
jgi:putative addiction module component (TIGR02574 family)